MELSIQNVVSSLRSGLSHSSPLWLPTWGEYRDTQRPPSVLVWISSVHFSE